jgi:hypothetical protein
MEQMALKTRTNVAGTAHPDTPASHCSMALYLFELGSLEGSRE